MADSRPIPPQDFDPWLLASALQLLHFMQRLGVPSRVIARQLGVKPAAISMWSHAKRPIPLGYRERLRLWAELAWQEASKRNATEVSKQPTEELQLAVQAELATIYDRWKLEVIHEAGTLDRVLARNYETLGRIVGKAHRTREDIEEAKAICDTMVQQMELGLTLQGEVQSPEDALIARLSAAHEVHEAARTTNPPEPES